MTVADWSVEEAPRGRAQLGIDPRDDLWFFTRSKFATTVSIPTGPIVRWGARASFTGTGATGAMRLRAAASDSRCIAYCVVGAVTPYRSCRRAGFPTDRCTPIASKRTRIVRRRWVKDPIPRLTSSKQVACVERGRACEPESKC